MKYSIAVVVPVHNFVLTPFERLGLLRIKRCLAHLPLILIHPTGAPVPEADWQGFEKLEIREIWGRYGETTVATYNRLLRSAFFYDSFSHYDYILVAQLDTYIFDNNLSAFVDQPYDYWGAPWFMDLYRTYPYLHDLTIKTRWPHILGKVQRILVPQCEHHYVGNGGLSLRRPQTFLRILEKNPWLTEVWEERCADWLKKGYDISYEDNFWCLFVPKKLPSVLRIAPWKKALAFAWETGPSLAYRVNKGKLPFGVHAWMRHEPGFWRQFLSQEEPHFFAQFSWEDIAQLRS